MTTDSTTTDDDANLFLGAAWFDPIEAGMRGQIRGFIEAPSSRNSRPRWGASATNAGRG